MQGQMKIFRVGSRQFRASLRELLRELWLSYWSSRERPLREWNFIFREWNFQFRELLREYPGTLRELREWPFHSESVFPEIGMVPRLLISRFSRISGKPDPPNLASKSKGTPEKSKGGTPNPWKIKKKRTTQKKQGKSENEKSKEIKKKTRIGGSGNVFFEKTPFPKKTPFFRTRISSNVN